MAPISLRYEMNNSERTNDTRCNVAKVEIELGILVSTPISAYGLPNLVQHAARSLLTVNLRF